MKDRVGKVVAATAAASLVCEVPLPMMADEFVVAEPAGPASGGTELEAAVQGFVSAIKGSPAAEDPGDLPPFLVNETALPASFAVDAPQTLRRSEREYPL